MALLLDNANYLDYLWGSLLALLIFSCVLGAYLILIESWISWVNDGSDDYYEYVGHIISKKKTGKAIITFVIKAVLMVGMAIPIGISHKAFFKEKDFLDFIIN